MKRTTSVLLAILCLASLALTAGGSKVHAKTTQIPLKGYSLVKPYPASHENAMAAFIAASSEGRTIPLDSFTFTASKDGNSYTDVIVGTSPFAARDKYHHTHVKVLLVPMEIHIGGNVFDAIVQNFCGGSMGNSDLDNLLNSPILTPVNFDGGLGPGHAALVNGVNMGKGTYNDTHRRAEFLRSIGSPKSDYGVLFDVTVADKQVITAATSSGNSAIITGSGCSLLGGLEINFFDNYFINTVLPAVHADPTMFVIFLMRDTVFYDSDPTICCILGYHGTLANMQTYSPFDYDTTGEFVSGIANVSIAAHEIGEWLDDPLGTNPTPLWGGIGQVGDCQGNWEVGDPLTGTDFPAITMPNRVIYNPQENAFWSWFYSKDHSRFFQNMTAGGKYSMNGTFGGPSKPCPPGGTFPN